QLQDTILPVTILQVHVGFVNGSTKLFNVFRSTSFQSLRSSYARKRKLMPKFITRDAPRLLLPRTLYDNFKDMNQEPET
ncbi:hypothetical protein STEG23_026809, partial [Scotinomys teguina]